MESFACAYCGSSLSTIRKGGTISLIADNIQAVATNTDRTAAELALVRLEKELKDVQKKLQHCCWPGDLETKEEFKAYCLRDGKTKAPGWWCRFNALLGDKPAKLKIKAYEDTLKSIDTAYESMTLTHGNRVHVWNNVMPILKAEAVRIESEIEINRKIVSRL